MSCRLEILVEQMSEIKLRRIPCDIVTCLPGGVATARGRVGAIERACRETPFHRSIYPRTPRRFGKALANLNSLEQQLKQQATELEAKGNHRNFAHLKMKISDDLRRAGAGASRYLGYNVGHRFDIPYWLINMSKRFNASLKGAYFTRLL